MYGYSPMTGSMTRVMSRPLAQECDGHRPSNIIWDQHHNKSRYGALVGVVVIDVFTLLPINFYIDSQTRKKRKEKRKREKRGLNICSQINAQG